MLTILPATVTTRREPRFQILLQLITAGLVFEKLSTRFVLIVTIAANGIIVCVACCVLATLTSLLLHWSALSVEQEQPRRILSVMGSVGQRVDFSTDQMQRLRMFQANVLRLVQITVVSVPVLFAGAGVRAGVITFDFAYSGAGYGNGATATGFVSFDDSLLPNPGSYYGTTSMPAFVTDLSVTVSGTNGGVGDGTFAMSDFRTIYWDTGSEPLDLTKELVGQLDTVGDFWGDFRGDWSLLAPLTPSNTPSDAGPFVLRAGSGELMQLTSFAPVVPEPSSIAFGFGASVVGIRSVRRRWRTESRAWSRKEHD